MRNLISELMIILAAREEEALQLEHRVAALELMLSQLLDSIDHGDRNGMAESALEKISTRSDCRQVYDQGLLIQNINKLLD